MALSLKTLSGDLAGIVGVIAVDDDDTVKLWKAAGAGSTSGITVGSDVSTANSAAFNSSASHKYFETNTTTGSGNAVASSGIVAITDVDVKVERTSGFAMMAVLAGTGGTVSTTAISTFIQAARSTADSEMTGLGRTASGGGYLLGTYLAGVVRGAGAEAWGASHGAGSIACTYDHASAGGQCYYGADGGALSTSGSAGISGAMNSGDHFVGGIGGAIDQSGQVTSGSTFVSGKFLCAIIWNSRPAESVFDNIHNDWLGTLFESGASGVVPQARNYYAQQ